MVHQLMLGILTWTSVTLGECIVIVIICCELVLVVLVLKVVLVLVPGRVVLVCLSLLKCVLHQFLLYITSMTKS